MALLIAKGILWANCECVAKGTVGKPDRQIEIEHEQAVTGRLGEIQWAGLITDKGDYILDNQNKNILLWSETRYRFIKRQSQSDPNVWVSLSNQQPAIGTATSR